MPGLFDFRSVGVSLDQAREEAQAIIDESKPPSRQLVEYAVPGERAIDVEYTNNTPVDIDVFVLSTRSTSLQPLQVVINEGLDIEALITTASLGASLNILQNQQNLQAVVPPGATYKVTNRAITKWQEYRVV